MAAKPNHKEPRQASVRLTAANINTLLSGESLRIRLRNVAGEEQILELSSPCHPKTKTIMREFDSLMEKFDELMQVVDGGGRGPKRK